MNYSSIHPTSIIRQKIYIDKKTILIVFPDTNVDISTEVYNIGFLLSNCKGLVVPNKVITIGRRKFNGRAHFFDVKKKMLTINNEKIGRKIRVLNSIIFERPDKEIVSSTQKVSHYYLYDTTIWSQALEYMSQHLSERFAVRQIFNELSELYKSIKSNNPTYDVDFVFLIKDQSGRMYQIIKTIRTMIKKDELKELTFFDDYGLISDCQNTIIPIFNKKDNYTNFLIQNINKLEKFIEVNNSVIDINNKEEKTIADTPEESSIETFNLDDETSKEEPSNFPVSKKGIPDIPNVPITQKPTSFISNLVQSLQTSKLVADTDKTTDEPKIKIKVNQDELKKALKNNKITDPDIIANIQIALNHYINTTKTKPSREEAEDLVLRAINYTITGSDVVPDEYLHHPELLFNKLKQINTYQVPLNITTNSENIIKPEQIIDLKYTTGQHRQRFEFETAIHENIQKLFQSLESVSNEYPIKVKKIESSVKDNNSDRFINYKVTLQNLNGGKKEPYVVELNVPSPVNDKYFKLHGNTYIMSNQQFLRPVTKTDKNEVRLISNYGIVRVGLANVKFNPTDLANIIKYIEIRYPKLISEKTDDFCKFSDNSIIYFTGENVYESPEINIIIDPESGRLQNKKTKDILKQNKYEFLYNTILDKIHTANPSDNLTKTKKALPYIWIYLGALKMPLILYLWSQKGLLSTLNDYGIDYEITDKEIPEKDIYYVPTKDGKFLKIMPKDLKEKMVVNGLSNVKLKEPIEDLTNPENIYNYITQTYGTRSILLLRLLTENFVDPITQELLQFENMPTNLVELSSKVAVDQLLNKQTDSLSDLKIYRARLSEIILNQVYKQIKLSHNYYRKQVMEGINDAKIFTDPDYVINNLLTEAGILQQTEPVNPVTEIMTASRVVKSGKGGKIMPHCIVIYRKNNLVNSGKLRSSNVEDNPELSFQKLLTSD